MLTIEGAGHELDPSMVELFSIMLGVWSGAGLVLGLVFKKFVDNRRYLNWTKFLNICREARFYECLRDKRVVGPFTRYHDKEARYIPAPPLLLPIYSCPPRPLLSPPPMG